MDENFTQIAHDPFGRFTTIRRQVPGQKGGCAWCGNHNAKGKLYQYGCWPDAGRLWWGDKLFCSVVCMRSYHY